MIVVLTGGTGGAKLVQGLQSRRHSREAHRHRQHRRRHRLVGPACFPGHRLDPVCAGRPYSVRSADGASRTTASAVWSAWRNFGQPGWFSLGDLDLATHLARTAMLRSGKSLSAVTAELAREGGCSCRVLLPMSDDRVATMLDTSDGTLNFQEYFVRERHQVDVRALRFEGADRARPSPGRTRKHRCGGSCHPRTEQSRHQHRTNSRGARHPRRAARHWRSRCCGQSRLSAATPCRALLAS